MERKNLKKLSDAIIIDTVRNSGSIRAAIKALGHSPSGTLSSYISEVLRRNGLRLKDLKKYKFDDYLESVKKILPNAISYNDLALRTGYLKNGRKHLSGNELTVLVEQLEKHGFEHSHLKKDKSWYNNHYGKKKVLHSHDDVFCINSKASHTTVKARYLKLRRIENTIKCDNDCGVVSKWNGSYIVLQIDHINGIRRDNRLKNLRLLCPNCHSQTETFGFKNRNAGGREFESRPFRQT